MQEIRIIYKIIERFLCMFLHGERYGDIKSLCFVEYANFLHEKKKDNQAVRYFEKALHCNPSSYYAYSGLTAVFAERRLFKTALDYWNKAASIKRPDVLMNLLLVVIYESLGDKVSATKALNNSLQFFEDNVAAAYNQLAYTYLHLGMYKEAEYYSTEAVKIAPGEAGLHNNLAKIYLHQNKFLDAKKAFQKVLEISSDRRYKKYALKSIKQIDNR